MIKALRNELWSMNWIDAPASVTFIHIINTRKCFMLMIHLPLYLIDLCSFLKVGQGTDLLLCNLSLILLSLLQHPHGLTRWRLWIWGGWLNENSNSINRMPGLAGPTVRYMASRQNHCASDSGSFYWMDPLWIQIPITGLWLGIDQSKIQIQIRTKEVRLIWQYYINSL